MKLTYRNTDAQLPFLTIGWAGVMMLVTVFCIPVMAQISPSCHYDFDNDDLTELTGNHDAGQADPDIQYICGDGTTSRALYFDGGMDTVSLDPDVKDLFDEDFSLSMSFWIEDTSTSHVLFSIQDSCEVDSSLVITYSSALSEIQVRWTRDFSELLEFRSDFNRDRCWHDLIFIRDGADFSFYLDNEFQGTQDFGEEVILGQDFPVYLGFSDCVPSRYEYFSGRIDEVRIYDRAIDVPTINSIVSIADNLLSQDTTIFEGDSFQILSGNTCAPQVQWSPSTALDDDAIAEPISSPTTTISYTVDYLHDSCVSTDSITIFVLNEDDIDCNTILLPTAFTPNGDGLNDSYGISNDFIIEDLRRFEIFDRWGLKLFETTDKSEFWDGTYQGQQLMPSSLVYKIEYQCRGENFMKSGRFNLIK